jgi:hypothetical protein
MVWPWTALEEDQIAFSYRLPKKHQSNKLSFDAWTQQDKQLNQF